MNSTSLPYRLATSLAVPLVPLLLRDARQREAHRARLASLKQLTAWGRQRDPQRPLAWFHAPSVGEGLQAEAVIQAFRAQHPDVQMIYTHYSPSAVSLAQRLPVDWAGYLPYDRRRDISHLLDALRPDILIFTKLDLWPELATQAAARDTRVVMIAATVEPGSSRLGWLPRTLARPGYRALSMIGAIAGGDAARLVQLGCAPERIVLTGDPRIDSVFDRIESPGEAPWHHQDGLQVMIAGSTWSDDEAILLRSFQSLRQDHPTARLIIVPHEPSPMRISEIESVTTGLKLPSPVRLSSHRPEQPLPAILLVDSTGILATLYRFAQMAYVGGGFGSRGIHSVLEPAAAGLPVIIGPADRGSRDAALLDEVHAITRLPATGAEPALTTAWRGWLTSSSTAEAPGSAARQRLLAERGASGRSADLLNRALRNGRGIRE